MLQGRPSHTHTYTCTKHTHKHAYKSTSVAHEVMLECLYTHTHKQAPTHIHTYIHPTVRMLQGRRYICGG